MILKNALCEIHITSDSTYSVRSADNRHYDFEYNPGEYTRGDWYDAFSIHIDLFYKEYDIALVGEDPSRADTVICKLRTLILSVQPHNLVTQNEIFKKLIFEENSYPFGKDGRMIPIRFFGTMTKENLALNEYIVTNQWVYPMQEGGHRFDIVLLINGFPIAIGELKTPVRSSVTLATSLPPQEKP